MATKKEDAVTAGRIKGRVLPTGSLIDKLHALREKKRALEAQVAVIEAEYSGIEEQLIAKLESDGIEKATGKSATASLSKTVECTIVDFEALEAWVYRTKNLSLFQRRVSAPVYRELLEKGKVPGTESFNRTKLNLRNL